MTHRDYLWCAVNLVLDGEEELSRLCPACRAEAESGRCPVCGGAVEDRGVNEGFDMERFLALGGEGSGSIIWHGPWSRRRPGTGRRKWRGNVLFLKVLGRERWRWGTVSPEKRPPDFPGKHRRGRGSIRSPFGIPPSTTGGGGRWSLLPWTMVRVFP